jgi:hypothetical protein
MVTPGDDILEGVGAGVVDHPVDLDAPGRGRHLVGMPRRIALVGAELVEVVVAGGVVIAGQRQVPGVLRLRLAADKPRPKKGTAPGHDLAAVEVHLPGRDIIPGEVGLVAMCHGTLRDHETLARNVRFFRPAPPPDT